MPVLNRRNFLQVLGAAGLAPTLPALPARAAIGGATSAQLLWASLYARAGNAGSAKAVASAMGISTTAAEGVFAKVVQANIVTLHGATQLGHAPRASALTSAAPAEAVKEPALKIDVEAIFEDEEPVTGEPDGDTHAETPPEV